MSLTFMTKELFVVAQEFVAATLTVVLPTGKDLGEVITVVPILYTNVGLGVPVTVTLEPKATDALQLFKAADILMFDATIPGTVFGAAVPDPATLVHPFSVLLTVRMPGVVTVIDAVVAPVLHSIVPPAGIDNTELPQLLTTVTIGARPFGAATADPTALIHPLTVLLTVYVPGAVTVMEAAVEPLLQRIVPPAGIDNVELPQLLATVMTGVAGVAFGAAVAEATALIQPFTVLLTV